jgi:electron transport complex protein RnfD
MKMQPIRELFLGARPGGIGETCAVIIMVAGLYLVYRNYVKWQLPLTFLAAAAVVAAVAPVQFSAARGSIETVWLPVRAEGWDVGAVYVSYHLLTGELMLAAFFLATEMTSRPVTTGGQVIFGLACGTLAMLLKLYVDLPLPAYMAVLILNTFVPTIDAIWLPRVFGRRFLWRMRRLVRP